MSNETAIIGVLLGVVQVAFWLWVKSSVTTMRETDKSLTDFKLSVANNYVKQTELDKHMDRIDKSLDEIKNMIASLAK